jgi:hypothetical protein
VAASLGCSSEESKAKSDGGGSTEPLAPTFSNVFSQVVLRGGGACASAQCHGLARGGGLKLDLKGAVHAQLLGIASEGLCIDGGASDAGPGFETCGCASTGKIRVVPFKPEESLFFEKIAGEPACGERMPPTGEPLPTEKVELVRQWILAGAPND